MTILLVVQSHCVLPISMSVHLETSFMTAFFIEPNMFYHDHNNRNANYETGRVTSHYERPHQSHVFQSFLNNIFMFHTKHYDIVQVYDKFLHNPEHITMMIATVILCMIHFCSCHTLKSPSSSSSSSVQRFILCDIKHNFIRRVH
jgi:hypothetical protein